MLGCVAEASQRNGCGFAKWITRQNLNGPDKTPFSPPIHLDAVSHLGLWPGRWSRTRRSEHIDPHWSRRVYRSRCPEHERQKMPMSGLDGLRRPTGRAPLAACRHGGAGWHPTSARLALPSDTDSPRSEEHTSELQSPCNLVCRLLLEK